MIIHLRWTELMAIRQFVSTDESRYNLSGVHFDIGAVPCIVATDGRAMGIYPLRATDPQPVPASFTLAAECIDALPPINDHSYQTVVDAVDIEYDPDKPKSIKVRMPGRIGYSWLLPTADFAYPDWRIVIPAASAEKAGRIILGTELLEKFGRAAEFLLPGHATSLRIRCADPAAPVLIRIGGTEFIGVLMPMSETGEAEYSTPNWVQKGGAK